MAISCSFEASNEIEAYASDQRSSLYAKFTRLLSFDSSFIYKTILGAVPCNQPPRLPAHVQNKTGRTQLSGPKPQVFSSADSSPGGSTWCQSSCARRPVHAWAPGGQTQCVQVDNKCNCGFSAPLCWMRKEDTFYSDSNPGTRSCLKPNIFPTKKKRFVDFSKNCLLPSIFFHDFSNYLLETCLISTDLGWFDTYLRCKKNIIKSLFLYCRIFCIFNCKIKLNTFLVDPVRGHVR